MFEYCMRFYIHTCIIWWGSDTDVLLSQFAEFLFAAVMYGSNKDRLADISVFNDEINGSCKDYTFSRQIAPHICSLYSKTDDNGGTDVNS